MTNTRYFGYYMPKYLNVGGFLLEPNYSESSYTTIALTATIKMLIPNLEKDFKNEYERLSFCIKTDQNNYAVQTYM